MALNLLRNILGTQATALHTHSILLQSVTAMWLAHLTPSATRLPDSASAGS